MTQVVELNGIVFTINLTANKDEIKAEVTGVEKSSGQEVLGVVGARPKCPR